MERRTGIIVSALALPVALLAALPAVAWQLTGELPVVGDPLRSQGEVHRLVKVRLTGAAQGQLSPGTSVPVSLTLKNPNSRPIRMHRVRVKIVNVVAPHADGAHPCTRADYTIRQMARRTLRLPARRTTDLTGLGLPVGSWPWLSMVDRPMNQDGCKGAQVKLSFKARGLKR